MEEDITIQCEYPWGDLYEEVTFKLKFERCKEGPLEEWEMLGGKCFCQHKQ